MWCAMSAAAPWVAGSFQALRQACRKLCVAPEGCLLPVRDSSQAQPPRWTGSGLGPVVLQSPASAPAGKNLQAASWFTAPEASSNATMETPTCPCCTSC